MLRLAGRTMKILLLSGFMVGIIFPNPSLHSEEINASVSALLMQLRSE